MITEFKYSLVKYLEKIVFVQFFIYNNLKNLKFLLYRYKNYNCFLHNVDETNFRKVILLN